MSSDAEWQRALRTRRLHRYPHHPKQFPAARRAGRPARGQTADSHSAQSLSDHAQMITRRHGYVAPDAGHDGHLGDGRLPHW